MLFRQIVDDQLAQHAYLVGCPDAGEALVVDPERDIDRYLDAAAREGLEITAVAETHIHADFLSGARELAEETGATVYLSAHGAPQGPQGTRGDGSYRWGEGYDARFLEDGDTLTVGSVELRALHTPGHTPEHVSFLVTDGASDGETPMGLLSGDFVFVGDTGRPDLLETAAGQQGAMDEGARALFGSVQRFLDMEDHLQVWPGHGAGSACGKALGGVPETTVGYERRVSPAMQAAQQGEQAFTDYVTGAQPEPPAYFARMKRLNRDGPPLLGALPEPERFSESDLEALGPNGVGPNGVGPNGSPTVIDARPDRSDFMRGHLPGALYAPFGKNFPTLAASYADPDQPVVLVIAEEHVEDATRSLVRVGMDRVEGVASPQALAAYAESHGGALESLPVIDMAEMDARRRGDGAQVLDVRSPDEYERGHVPGALLAPHTRLAERLGALPRDRTLLVHCGGGRRASSAASLLAARGFDAVHVDDRFSNWSEAHPDAVEPSPPSPEEAPA